MRVPATHAALAASVSLVVACGGGGGGSPTTSSPVIQKTYTASATAGEVLSYSVDTLAGTYSYEIIHSAYGLTGQQGSGTLSVNNDGTYSPSESPSSKIVPLDNGLMLGSVNLMMNGTSRSVPILGMSEPATAANDLEGTYNFITMQCATPSNGIYDNCQTSFGTLQVIASSNTTATFSSCIGANIANGINGCNELRTGSVNYSATGIWTFRDSASVHDNYMLAFRSPNGQKVGWLDFNDPTVFGFGQGVVSEQGALQNSSDLDGEYIFKNTRGNSGNISITSNVNTQQINVSNGNSLTLNTPWTGMARSANNFGTGIMAGNGVYVYMNTMNTNSSAPYYEIGIRK